MSDWWGYEGGGCGPVPPYPYSVPGQGPNLTNIDASLALVTPSDTGISTPLTSAIGGRVQRAGDTMGGRLLLGMGNPVSSLEAVCKQYVDQQCQLASIGALPAGQISLTYTSNTIGNGLYMDMAPTQDRGGAPGAYTALSAIVLQSTVWQNPDLSASRFNAEELSVQLFGYTEGRGDTTGLVAVGTHVSKFAPQTAAGAPMFTPSGPNGYGGRQYLATDVPAGTTLIQAWSIYGTAVDKTGLPSRIGGPLACQEYDMQVNGIDDQGVRGGYAFNGDIGVACDPTNLSGNGAAYGTCSTIGQGFYSYGLNDAWINIAFRVGGNHILAGMDTRAVTGTGTPSATTVLTAAAAGATSVHVANATPFAQGTDFTGSGVSASHPIYNVTIGTGTVYEVVGYASDGPGTRSGTLTLSTSTPILGTDGAAGNAVSRPFYSLISATGHRIGFDYNGNASMYYSTSALGGAQGVLLTSNLQVNAFQAASILSTGPISCNGVFNVQGASQFGTTDVLATLTAHDGLNVSGGFFNFSVFAYASVPNPGYCPHGGAIWISDACKPGEASGSGSGVIAIPNGAFTAWLRASDYAIVTH